MGWRKTGRTWTSESINSPIGDGAVWTSTCTWGRRRGFQPGGAVATVGVKGSPSSREALGSGGRLSAVSSELENTLPWAEDGS